MLAIITPELGRGGEVVRQVGGRATVIGHVVEPTIDENGRAVAMLRVRQGFDGEILAEVPASSLADEALSTIDR